MVTVTEPLEAIVVPAGMFGRSDDLVHALQAASMLMSDGFAKVAGCTQAGQIDAARGVTAVADVFVAWLRRPVSITFGPATVTEQDSGEIVSTAGGSEMNIDTSQVVTWDVDPEDDRGFDVTTPLDVANSDDSVATVVYTAPADGNLGTIAATAVAPGATMITVSVPGSDPLISGSLAVDVSPGGVASIEFGEPVVTEQAATPPPVEPPVEPAPPVV